MHFYKKNIADYHKKAGRLTMIQHGAYTLLMDACYDRERFPTEAEAIDWLWASSTEEIEAIRFVLAKFFMIDDGKYIQPRIEREVEDYQSKAKTNQRIAREREEKRRNKRLGSTNRAQDVDEVGKSVNEAPPNYELGTTNQEPLTNNKSNKESNARAQLDWSNCSELTKEHIAVILANRKTKKATNSQRAINQIMKAINESLNQGYDIEQIINLIAEKGWSSYKHEWLINSGIGFNQQANKTSFDMSNALNNMANCEDYSQTKVIQIGGGL